jgi:hypothetical protein
MRFICLTIVVCCALAGLQAAPASAERRVALVLGNGDYRIGPLANPLNDAAAVAEAFDKRLGFDKVMLRTNLGAEAFRAALLEFSREAAGADLGVVYFAGHGTEVGGRNFLIPVDATLARANALALEAIPLDAVLAQLEGVRKLKLVILDACRNNLFRLGGAKRSIGRGLVRIEPEGNTLVAFAAREGTTADDGRGRHSPYTAALLKHIATPGLEINLLFRRVRTDVLAATGGGQQPAEYHSLGAKEIFLLPPPASAAASPPMIPPPAPQPEPPPVSAPKPATLGPEAYVATAGGSARLVAAGDLTLDGKKVICGRRPTVLDSKLDDYSAAYPGFIILNPKLLERVPTSVKLWVHAHACGYQYRGPDPKVADCFAVQRGRRQGWLTREGLDEVCAFITPALGSKVHLPGPQRCELMRRCYDDPTPK